jgi:hypothetical protein
MGNAKLIEVPDDMALRAVELLLREHSKQGEAGAVNLIFTGKRFQDLLELEGSATRPHYGIHGFLAPDLDAKDEIVRLLTGGHTQVSLNLHYPWGVLPVFLRSGVLDIELEPPSPGWLLQGLLGGLLPIQGVEPVVTSSGGREGMHLSFPTGMAGRIDELLREIAGRLDPPSKVHVILTGDLKTARELYESGKVIPCDCCAWHFDYVDLLAQESDVDPARLGGIAGFLAKRLGRDRALTFRGFTWSWEEGLDPSLANAVVWSVPKRGPGWLEVRWYDPMPRSTLGVLREEVRQFLSNTGSVNAG